jgi:outer membrane receptor for ferrienterochelin and colicin
MKKAFITILISGIWYIATSQTFTVSGYIGDVGNKETLVGSFVTELSSNKGTASNVYGFYSISLPKGKVSLQYTHVGYATYTIDFDLHKDTTLHIYLEHIPIQLNEVVVQSRSSHANRRLGLVSIPAIQLKSIPVLMGEPDILKSLQLLPGVQQSVEGKSDFSVRGGSPDQNLVLLDGVPIYNTNHVYGFFSIFNSDAIKNVDFYKSMFPARFGGRLSSVVDIRTNDGNMEKIEGSASLGLISAKVRLEGPLKKDKASFYLSYRRTYVDLFLGSIVSALENSGDGVPEGNKYNFYFYDLNAKLNYKLSDKNSLFFMFYNGTDKMNIQYSNREGERGEVDVRNSSDWKWGNTIVAAKLNRTISKNLFLNSALSYNRYHYESDMQKKFSIHDESGPKTGDFAEINYGSGINDYSFTSDLDFVASHRHYARAGIVYTYHRFNPEVISLRNSENENSSSDMNVDAHEAALYAEDDWKILNSLTLNFGLRASLFNVQSRTYTALSPRISLSYSIAPRLSVKAGYAAMQQYIHLLSSNAMFLQTDLWVPTTKNISPMNAVQYSAGVFYDLPYGIELSAEAYYKTMDNLLEYKDGASFTGTSTGWEDKVEDGIGRSYGIELFLKKTAGRTTGWVSYTLAKSERRFEIINYGAWFPAKYDRRHSLSITLTQQLSRKWELSANWVYSTGNVTTVPLMEIFGATLPHHPYPGQIVVEQLESRNNYRMSDYHRLDVGLTYYTNRSKPRYGMWNLSIYNAYNRRNPFLLSTDFKSREDTNTKVLKQVTFFPVIPSISYTYKF